MCSGAPHADAGLMEALPLLQARPARAAIVELMDEGLCADVEFALPLDPGLALV